MTQDTQLDPPPEPGPGLWRGFLDDAAAFPPHPVPLHEATAAYGARTPADAAFVHSLVLHDTDLPLVRGSGAPLTVVVTGGAGQLAGPVGLAARLGLQVVAIEVALRDLDDLAGNARRVVAALDSLDSLESLDVAVAVHVELPVVEPTASWLAAADELAAAELALALRTGGLSDVVAPPEALAACLDAALDRELTFRSTGGQPRALRHTDAAGLTHQGIVSVLLATGLAFDGAGRDEVVAVLGGDAAPDPTSPTSPATMAALATGRRWCTSVGCGDVDQLVADLRALGLAP